MVIEVSINEIVTLPDGSVAYAPSLLALEASDDAIRKLELELSSLKSEREGILKACLAANVDTQGNRTLFCKTRVEREVVVDMFKERFPEAYATLKSNCAKVLQEQLDYLVEKGLDTISPVDAEKLVGKIPLHPMTIPHAYKKYSVVIIPGDRE